MDKTDSEKEKAAQGADYTKAAKQNRQRHYHANSAHAQRQRIADWFNTTNSLTTEQARRDLDIMHPAGRIKELRRRGYDILTFTENHPTIGGQMHRMARYVCMKSGGSHE